MTDRQTDRQTVPQLIHFCWFGNNLKPRLAKRCIKSWRNFFPGYQIIEWNEKNYDIQSAPLYVRQAYDAKKWAFVSDYVRFDIIYKVGGVYFDTDVEVVKSMTDLLQRCGYIGCEDDGGENSIIRLNPGIGMAFEPSNKICREILDSFTQDKFVMNNGEYNYKTIDSRATEVFLKHGMKNVEGIQMIDGVCVYPKEYFAPLDRSTGIMNKTNQTRSIHWWDSSWRLNVQYGIIGRYLRTRVRKLLGNKYITLRNRIR